MGARLLNASQNELRSYVIALGGVLPLQINQSKVAALNTLNAQWHARLAPGATLPPGYKPFGSPSLTEFDQHTLAELRTTIALLFQTNPFYASALSLCDLDRPCLRARQGNGWYAKILRNIDRKVYPVIDAIFDTYLNIVDFRVYKILANGTEVTLPFTELEAYQLLSALTNYYSECIHTVLHTFQYVIGAGLVHATENTPAMRLFANTYSLNVYKTYNDVVGLDLRPGGVLVGGLFAANRDGILRTLSTMVGLWGSFTTAQQFLDEFVLAGFSSSPSVAASLGLMTAFQTQTALLGPYADDVSSYFETHSDYNLALVEQELASFFSQCGRQTSGEPTFQLGTINVWLQLQAITSLVHSGTFSFTRFMGTKSAIIALSPSDLFTTWDMNYFRSTAPTIVGAQNGRFVMASSQLVAAGVSDSELLALVGQHSNRSAAAKTAELARWQAMGKIETHGWIASDYFPEGFDGKQLTLNTYI